MPAPDVAAPLPAGVGVFGLSDVVLSDAGTGAAGAAGVWVVFEGAGVDGGFVDEVAVELAGAAFG